MAALLAGCSGTTGSGSSHTPEHTRQSARAEQVEVLTDYWTEGWQRLRTETLIPHFERQTGLDVTILRPPQGASDWLARLAEDGNLPDTATGSTPQVLGQWSDDMFRRVGDIVDGMQSLHGGLVVTPPGLDGTWQVPHGYQAATFQYRQDVYDHLGLNVPSSFRGVLDNARAIDGSDLDIRGYGLAGTDPPDDGGGRWKSSEEFQTYLAQMGVSPVGLRWRDPDRRDRLEVDFPEREVTALLQFFADLAQYSPDPTELDRATSARVWALNRDVGWRPTPFAQQFGYNNLTTMTAAVVAREREGTPRGAHAREAAANTGVAEMPYWEAGGVSAGDSWLYRPWLHGRFVVAGGSNAAGAKRWLEWLYAADPERTALLYRPSPALYLPAVDGVLASERFRSRPLFGAWPRLLEQMEYVQETVVGEHYGAVSEANLADPVAFQVGRQGFYGEMVHRVVADGTSPQEAYEWGRDRLLAHLDEARDRFRG